jgi:hypothetical protein
MEGKLMIKDLNNILTMHLNEGIHGIEIWGGTSCIRMDAPPSVSPPVP